jgi:hypothetical protein
MHVPREREMVAVRWGKWLVVTVALGIAAFIASPNAPLGGFWGTPPSLSPTAAQKARLAPASRQDRPHGDDLIAPGPRW